MAETVAEDGTIRIIETPIQLHYEYTPGVAASKFLNAMKDHIILGQRCPKCSKVYFPARGACSMCGVELVEEVELSGKGTVASFAVTMVPGKDLPAPYVTAWVLLDGCDITAMFLVREVEHTEVRLGMRVEAVWVPDDQLETNLGNITHFKPLDEPDAPYESYRDYV